MEQLIMTLLGHGPIGLVAAVALYFAYKKNQEVKELYTKILSWEEKRATWVSDLFSELNKTVRMLTGHEDEEEDK